MRCLGGCQRLTPTPFPRGSDVGSVVGSAHGSIGEARSSGGSVVGRSAGYGRGVEHAPEDQVPEADVNDSGDQVPEADVSDSGGQVPEADVSDADVVDELPEDLDASEFVGPYTFPNNNRRRIPAAVYLGDEGARLQALIPDELPYDLAMNIFTFETGHSLPVVETHVMEHGLWFLQGKGLYYLDDAWMEVERDDFIWMGPYVPQSFYATGPGAAKYLYSKNVNRDIPA